MKKRGLTIALAGLLLVSCGGGSDLSEPTSFTYDIDAVSRSWPAKMIKDFLLLEGGATSEVPEYKGKDKYFYYVDTDDQGLNAFCVEMKGDVSDEKAYDKLFDDELWVRDDSDYDTYGIIQDAVAGDVCVQYFTYGTAFFVYISSNLMVEPEPEYELERAWPAQKIADYLEEKGATETVPEYGELDFIYYAETKSRIKMYMYGSKTDLTAYSEKLTAASWTLAPNTQPDARGDTATSPNGTVKMDLWFYMGQLFFDIYAA